MVIAMIPFGPQEFFGVFADYNTSVWPAQIFLYALAVAMVAMALRGKSRGTPWIPVGLALLWIWTGVAYHLWKFTAINGPAWVFGALFVIEGVLFVTLGTSGSRLEIGKPTGWKGWIGGILVAYSLVVYPLLGLSGHPPEEVPVLGVPCPTTIFTFGLLFWAARPIPPRLLVIPLLWTLIGSSAFFLFGVVQDVGLLAAGVLGLLLLRANGRPSAQDTAPADRSEIRL